MADKLIITAGYVSLDGGTTDHSAEIESFELTPSTDAVDTTSFGDSGVRTFRPGLQVSSITLNVVFNDDESTGLHAYMRSNGGTFVSVQMRNSSGSVATTNPSATVSALCPNAPLGGTIGQAFKRSFTLQCSGAITWATS